MTFSPFVLKKMFIDYRLVFVDDGKIIFRCPHVLHKEIDCCIAVYDSALDYSARKEFRYKFGNCIRIAQMLVRMTAANPVINAFYVAAVHIHKSITDFRIV